jgi:hypothetical protein
MTQTFWLEPTEMMQVALRCFTLGSTSFDCAGGYHSAMADVRVVPGEYEVRDGRRHLVATESKPALDDPNWPTTCDSCGYAFTADDPHQFWQAQVYERTDTGDLVTLREAPVGACWDAWWLPDDFRGPDGIALAVQCHGQHTWHVDARASNCGRPDDNTHHCWVRHGDPRECHVTVDKDGDTCSAGAGSIVVPGWHGFLRGGRLVEC